MEPEYSLRPCFVLGPMDRMFMVGKGTIALWNRLIPKAHVSANLSHRSPALYKK